MKTVLMALALAAAALAAPAHAAETGALTVVVSNLKPKGKVMIGVYAGEAGLKSGKTFTGAAVDPAGGKATARFDLPPGDYVVRLYQDVDGDGKLKSGMLGMPAEPWAVSNDAPIKMGPPTYADSRFTVPAGGAVTQTLKAR